MVRALARYLTLGEAPQVEPSATPAENRNLGIRHQLSGDATLGRPPLAAGKPATSSSLGAPCGGAARLPE